MSALRSALRGACLALAVSAPALSSLAEPAPEPVRWLQEYLQIDTTNPPGNEREAAEFLAAILAEEGIEPRLLTSPEGRTSLYARWASPRSGGRALVLLHHIDVVAADGEWRVAPFSGRPLEGRLWGRGALDVKGLGIAQLAAILALKAEGVELGYDLVYLAVADEEVGGGQGVGWLLDAHPELFENVEAVFGEGGFNRVLGDRLIWWGIEVAQKRPLWLELTARGRPGHASGLNPGSATHQLVLALARLVERPLRYRVTDEARLFLGALAELEGGATAELYRNLDEVILPEGPVEPLPPGLPVYFLDTLQVTRIDAGSSPNAIAPEARARVDLRLLPDADTDALLEELRALAGPGVEVEAVLTAPPAAPSPVAHPVFRTLAETLEVRAPVVPAMISGVTDSRYFRQRGIPAYGFSPFALNPDDLRGIHAADERMPVDAYLRGIETLRRVLLAYAQASGSSS